MHKLFLDKALVLFGAPFRAYAGMDNIGHLWDLRGESDTSLMGKGTEEFAQWDLYNEGFRTISSGVYGPDRWQFTDLNIYLQGATRCTLFGADYIHYGSGDYFDTNRTMHPFQGMECSNGKTIPRGSPARGARSRLEANLSFLINVVGVGRVSK